MCRAKQVGESHPPYQTVQRLAVRAGILDQRELEGVMAHELAHLKHPGHAHQLARRDHRGGHQIVAHMAFFFGRSRDDDRGGNALVMLEAPYSCNRNP